MRPVPPARSCACIAALVALLSPVVVAAQPSLTNAVLFQANGAGNNVQYGIWNTDPFPYAKVFFSTTPAPSPTWLNPAVTISAPLSAGLNTLYFFGDQYDPRGYAGFFGLNLYLSGAANPTLSGLVAQGAGNLVGPNGGTCTPQPGSSSCQPAANTLNASIGGWNVSLTSFQVLGLGSNNLGGAQPSPQSTTDLVSSFSIGSNGLYDTYGTVTLAVTPVGPAVTTPEPATWALLAGGLAMIAAVGRRRATSAV